MGQYIWMWQWILAYTFKHWGYVHGRIDFFLSPVSYHYSSVDQKSRVEFRYSGLIEPIVVANFCPSMHLHKPFYMQ